ncbi:hypothetical protein CQW23_16771 [Capsicum baccatum]|uniref:Uncharacterized protein n=1 Tax=Capsicum baccatum TaxID=33114 RepID=A0A2G2WBV3_CAPBA|nr:hypothetical protein CQW23_16771 [Capsicum baccatum]
METDDTPAAEISISPERLQAFSEALGRHRNLQHVEQILVADVESGVNSGATVPYLKEEIEKLLQVRGVNIGPRRTLTGMEMGLRPSGAGVNSAKKLGLTKLEGDIVSSVKGICDKTSDDGEETHEEVTLTSPTWPSLAEGARGMNLSFVEPVIIEGERVAQIYSDEIAIEIPKWKKVVILYVVGDSSSMGAITSELLDTAGLADKAQMSKGVSNPTNIPIYPDEGGLYETLGDSTKDIRITRVVHVREQFVHGIVSAYETNKQFYFTVVYGKHTITDRRPLWESLKHLAVGIDIPWALTGQGDFNAMLHTED